MHTSQEVRWFQTAIGIGDRTTVSTLTPQRESFSLWTHHRKSALPRETGTDISDRTTTTQSIDTDSTK